jgi:hypothetical protein
VQAPPPQAQIESRVYSRPPRRIAEPMPDPLGPGSPRATEARPPERREPPKEAPKRGDEKRN